MLKHESTYKQPHPQWSFIQGSSILPVGINLDKLQNCLVQTMLFEVQLDADMYEEAEFRQLIAEYGGEIINEKEEEAVGWGQ
jgi:hypothetical protein